MTRWRDDSDKTEEFEDVETKADTEAALLCVIDGKDQWVPRSVIHEDSEVQDVGDDGTLILKAWWAKKEGLV